MFHPGNLIGLLVQGAGDVLADLAAQSAAAGYQASSADVFENDCSTTPAIGGGLDHRRGDGGITFDRIAPCLLPEQKQVQALRRTLLRILRAIPCYAMQRCSIERQIDDAYRPSCMLPQVGAVRVTGPRYWHQQLLTRQGAVGSGRGPSLDALYATRTLFVQRKAGALPYADDPSGETCCCAPHLPPLEIVCSIGCLSWLLNAAVALLYRRRSLTAEPHGTSWWRRQRCLGWRRFLRLGQSLLNLWLQPLRHVLCKRE